MREEIKEIIKNATTKYLDKMAIYLARGKKKEDETTLEDVIAETLEKAGYVKLTDKDRSIITGGYIVSKPMIEADLLYEINFFPPVQNDYGRGYLDGLTRALDVVKGVRSVKLPL